MTGAEVTAGFKVLGAGVKGLLDIADIAKNAQAKKITMDMMNEIIPLQGSVLGLQNENAELRSELRELKEKLAEKEDMTAFKKGLTFNKSHYVRKVDGIDEYYCPTCLDSKNMKIRLVHYKGKAWACAVCKAVISMDFNG
jgi:regulator of replication initiation timing